jgi:hypothetical protein
LNQGEAISGRQGPRLGGRWEVNALTHREQKIVARSIYKLLTTFYA